MKYKWKKGDVHVLLPNAIINLSAPLLWLDQLPDGRLLITTLFDELTPKEQTNVFVYYSTGMLEREIFIEANARPVRFIGSPQEYGQVRLLGTNGTKYTLNTNNWTVDGSQYYR